MDVVSSVSYLATHFAYFLCGKVQSFLSQRPNLLPDMLLLDGTFLEETLFFHIMVPIFKEKTPSTIRGRLC